MNEKELIDYYINHEFPPKRKNYNNNYEDKKTNDIQTIRKYWDTNDEHYTSYLYHFRNTYYGYTFR